MPDNIEGGMSGSPIVADDGSAIGLISVSGDDRRKYAYCTGLRAHGDTARSYGVVRVRKSR